MGVGIVGVIMIHGHPIELGAQVFFHLRHQVTGKDFHITQIGSVFRRDDKAKLVPISFGLFKEFFAVYLVLGRTIKLARFAVFGYAVTLYITQMRPGFGKA